MDPPFPLFLLLSHFGPEQSMEDLYELGPRLHGNQMLCLEIYQADLDCSPPVRGAKLIQETDRRKRRQLSGLFTLQSEICNSLAKRKCERIV
ncbi:hypothetical protein CEXT_85131 [Caerostris extrusa]|uniref:Uncharacterized protein n=1 Tax=Caerostris extrusa TaxID=172846 RepID=A0AAV4X1V5_CAEEX|nr:hypothetical protein CEXT_85131 [Caerostris extrusa]